MTEKPGEPESFEVRIPGQEGVGKFSHRKDELQKMREGEARGDKTKEELARAAEALKQEEADAKAREAAKAELEQKMFEYDLAKKGIKPKKQGGEMKEAA